MSNIFNYLFDVYAGPWNLLFWQSILGVASFAIIIGLIGLVMQRSKDQFTKHLWYRLTAWGLFSGFFMFLIAGFRYLNVYLLSMRFWIFAWLLFSGVWLLRILKWWIVDVPKAKSRRRDNQSFRKYLPQ